MSLGNRVRNRHLAAGRRKSIAVSSGIMTGHVLGRYMRSMSALRPMSLVFMRQSLVRSEERGVTHRHTHMHLNWQMHFANISQLMSGGLQSRSRGTEPLRADSKSSLIHQERRVPDGTYSPLTGENWSRGKRTVRGPWQEVAHPLVPSREKRSAGMPKKAGIPPPSMPVLQTVFYQRSGERVGRRNEGVHTVGLGSASVIHMPGEMRGFPLVVRGNEVIPFHGRTLNVSFMQTQHSHQTDIRVLSQRPEKEAATAAGPGEAAITKRVVHQAAPEKVADLQWTKAGREAAQMIVKREVTESSAGEVQRQGATIPASSPMQTVVAGSAQMASVSSPMMQPRIDVNRLTDEVYRMLERRLITERERRGR